LFCLALLIFGLAGKSIAQTAVIYTSLEDAMKCPEKVEILELKYLDLKSLPADFDKLTHLRELDLSNNSFVFFPQQLLTLKKLEKLNFSHNQLNQLYPKIEVMHSLRELDLSFNKFSDFPVEVTQLKRLKKLNLSGGTDYLDWNASGQAIKEIPSEIRRMKSLEYLGLNGNQVNVINPGIEKLSLLKELDLAFNSVNDSTALSRIALIPHLEILDLQANNITYLPSSFAKLQQLKILNLNNYFTEGVPGEDGFAEFPEVITQLKNLEEIDLLCKNIQTLPAGFFNLKKLKVIELADNSIDSLPDLWNMFPALEVLDLSIVCYDENDKACADVFVLPSSILKVKTLKQIILFGRNVSDETVITIKEKLPSCELLK
jgi:Leucine-rich repeat (LRR) protein